jgi:hypothetical protein
MSDILQEIDKLQRDNDQLRKDRASSRRYNFVFLMAIAFIFVTGSILISNIQHSADITILETRRGVFSLNETILKDSPSYAERFQTFTKKAKAVILETYETAPPTKKWTDKQINEFLSANFRYSEQYMVDPWIAVAYARCESNFSSEAVSAESGASGTYQFMPSTMKILMGDDYYPGCEQNIQHSTKMFFKYYLSLSESFDGKIRWIAAAYVAGSYYPYSFYQAGKSFDQYYHWFKLRQAELVAKGIINTNHSEYMNRINYFYERFRDL